MGLETLALQKHNLKEVVGLAFCNEAATFSSQEKHREALASYQQALKYLPENTEMKEWMGYQYLIVGEKKKGEALLREVQKKPNLNTLDKTTLIEDYFWGRVNLDGIQAVFMQTDETRASVIKKRDRLQKIVARFPKFRAGLFSLSITWCQLNREGEALEWLTRYHEIEPNDPSAEYYLTILNARRLNYPQAWKHYRQLQQILAPHNHNPKVVKELHKALVKLSPD